MSRSHQEIKHDLRASKFREQRDTAKDERIALLENALRFYANSDHYLLEMQWGRTTKNYIAIDNGERARKALNGEVSEDAKALLG